MPILYTTQPKYERALALHGPALSSKVGVVLGEAIPTGDGNFREKGVDAVLVADLIYHAAVRNYQQAILFSADQDFAHALTDADWLTASDLGFNRWMQQID